MTQTLLFTNPGQLDINLVKLLGVSVKESDNPIGFFGTGLKYAIAVTLRLGGEISIYTGGVKYDLAGEKLLLRGQEFTRVTINGEALGFTTELGKTWEPWMVVRELYSNAADEGGFTDIGDFGEDYLSASCEKDTHVVLEGAPFIDAWASKDLFFINENEQPVYRSEFVDLYRHRCGDKGVFYRGIRVGTLEKTPHYRYNIKSKVDLTEDRCVKYLFQIKEAVEKMIVTSDNATIVSDLLEPKSDTLEGDLTFTNGDLQGLELSETFTRTCSDLAKRKSAGRQRQALKFYHNRTQTGENPMTPVKLTSLQQKQLDRVLAFLAGFSFMSELEQYPIVTVAWLGEHVTGQALDGTIYLTPATYEAGTKSLASTILEEFVHLHHHLRDESRELQTWLFDRIISMGEEQTGDPL